MTNTTPQKTKHHDKDSFTHVARSYSNYIHLCKFMQIYVNSCKFIATKERIRNEVDSHRTGLGYQHDRRFIFMGHQHDGRDVMWKGSIDHERP